MRLLSFHIVRIATFTIFSTSVLLAQHHKHEAKTDDSRDDASHNCYDASDPSEIRLWPGAAPGAIGDDPCRDIPYIRVFPSPAGVSKSGQGLIVIPGGGYDRLSDAREQTPVANYFSQQLGVTTFVLYYRLVQPDGSYRYPVPMWDGQRALKLVRTRARDFGIAPERVGLFGFSAGGHLATTLTLHSATDFNLPVHDRIDAADGRPNLLGLGYPVISMDPAQFAATSSHNHLLYGYTGPALDHLQDYLSGQDHITPHTSPIFLFESLDDQRISPQNSVIFVDALKRAGIPVEPHLFAHGVHGGGLAQGIPEEEAWPTFFAAWLKNQR
jgi:acetyl esterase/lipase